MGIFGLFKKPKVSKIDLQIAEQLKPVSVEESMITHEITVDLSKIGNKSSDDFEDYKKDLEKLKKKQDKKQDLNDVLYPFFLTIEAMNTVRRPYFTYKKSIDVIRDNLLKIIALPKNKTYDEGKDKALKLAKKQIEYFMITEDIQKMLDEPSLFLSNLNDYHKTLLLKTPQNLYNYWLHIVKDLKQKPAKEKRKQYLIEGLKELKNELITVNPTFSEMNSIDVFILNLEKENWSEL